MSKSALLEYADDQLVRIKPTGMLLDPRCISVLHVVALADRNAVKANGERQGKLIIETRNGGTYSIYCNTSKEASQLRDTLGMIVNKRSKEAAARLKLRQSTDWGKQKLAGDAKYEEERENVFMAFD